VKHTDECDIFAVLGGYYQSLVLLHLLRAGVLDSLQERRTAENLALALDWQPGPLRACLDFLAETTGIIRRDRSRRYFTTLPCEQISGLVFQVEKFAGAYGRTAQYLPDILARGGPGGQNFVDRRSLARAFGSIADSSRGWVTALIIGARPSTLLDLGCGSGSLLVQLAKLDPEFRGIGVEASGSMCAMARRHVRKHSLRSRIEILHHDARLVEDLPDATALHAASLMNEMFKDGPSEAIEFLRRLKRRFGGRNIWLVDYYGRLGNGRVKSVRAVPHVLLHDLVQILSGQGMPPPDIKAWRSIYRAANCSLREVHEFSEAGLDWFVHRLRL
jgi:SAM-dependent methyltransferase